MVERRPVSTISYTAPGAARAYANDLVVRAARGERTPRTPIWLMRQAGRTDPEYLRLRAESGLALQDLFSHPEWASRISLLPRRIGVDAIIYFQDILTPLGPMGAPFVFAPGPKLAEPIRSREQIDALRTFDCAVELPFIPDILGRIGQELDGAMPVLGFAGAPLTLAVFLIEGSSFGGEANAALAFMRERPDDLHALLETLTLVTIEYLHLQIDAGIAAWQLFESAAHLLSVEEYEAFALPYQQRIFNALRGLTPSIMFAREWEDLVTLKASGADILSLPSTVSIADARSELGVDTRVQGNLDNRLLMEGQWPEIELAAGTCLREGDRTGHIFNLSHGLLSETPFEHVTKLVQFVREFSG
jgi:uroporphyrinogen decarboxylase